MTDPTDQPRDTDQETWLTARRWVTENMRLIHWIANPYRTHMAADEDDLLQEATMAAFQALTTAEKKQAAQRFVPFFRVIFKTRCLRLASGIQTVQPANDVLLDACTLEAASPLPELLAIADRMLILHQGRVAGILEGETMTQQNVLQLAVQGAD